MLTTILLFYALPYIVLTILVETELYGWATFAALAGAAAFSWLHRHDVLGYLHDHGLELLINVGIYVAIGVVWSYARWVLKLIKFRTEFREQTEAFKVAKKLPLDQPIPSEQLNDFRLWLPYDKRYLRSVPRASEHKSNIVAWMSFWPCSVLGYLLRDPIKRLFDTLFDLLKSSYQRIADGILHDPEMRDISKED